MIGGKYEVLSEPIGVGGFGAVYRVRHDVSDDIFALKLLHGHLAREPAIVRSFLDEVKRPASFSKVVGAFGRVPRERVVRVTDAGIDAALESPFMVMPLLEGEGLHDRLGREGRLPPAVALDLLKDLACVLDEAHSGGNPIIHRDLKPENLFVERREHGEQLRVLDFGIAKAANASGNETLRVFGTPQFMAPEQWDPAGDVTPRTDVWALGLIAFNALVGASFWLATHHHQLAPLVLLRPIPRASERAHALGVALPPAFDEWFARCVARDPAARFERAGRAVAALETAIAAWPGLPPAPPPPEGGLTRPPPQPPAPGVGLDVRLRNRQRLPVGEVRSLLHELAEKVEGVRSHEARDASLALTPEHVRFVPNGSKEDIALWEAQPPPETSAERRGTRTLVARFGVGDFAYFAPEALRSAKGSEQADVWSLAVLSFEALVGVRFWPQESIPALLHAMESDPVPTASARAAAVHDAPALPEGFDGWFARCTAREPGGRYRTPTHALLGFEKLFVQPPSPRPTRRGFVLAAAGVVAVVALVAAVGRAVIARPEPSPPTVVDTRPAVTPFAPSLACEELPSRGNPFVRVANIGCVQQHEVSEREYAAWRDGGTTSLMPQRDVARGDAAAYCRGLGATLPPARLWDLLAQRRGSLTASIHFPQGDDARPVGPASALDDFEGVRDLVGNLAEWTSDPPLPNGRLMVRGARFNSLPDEVLTQVQEGESVPDRPSPQRGFRCAVVREGPWRDPAARDDGAP